MDTWAMSQPWVMWFLHYTVDKTSGDCITALSLWLQLELWSCDEALLQPPSWHQIMQWPWFPWHSHYDPDTQTWWQARNVSSNFYPEQKLGPAPVLLFCQCQNFEPFNTLMNNIAAIKVQKKNLWKTFIFQYWHWYRKHKNLWWIILLL